jgi:hypothetical protein
MLESPQRFWFLFGFQHTSKESFLQFPYALTFQLAASRRSPMKVL